jgi:sodium-independent sulfate anion transporter 11
LLRRRLPIVGWLPNYNLNYSVFDLIAGVTVGLTIIPQSIAYAGVAGLPFEVLI